MELRPARQADLPQLNGVYRAVIRHMEQGGLKIWDEIYPCCCFPQDIAEERLFLLRDGEALAGAFALCGECQGGAGMQWADPSGRALYLERLAVAPAYLGRGLGGRLLREAAGLARTARACALRLLVVDTNQPAIRLYRKNGWKQVEGGYDLELEGCAPLHELGFELVLA